jgi:hypothetical protein
MVKALDTLMTKEEEEEIGQVYTQRYELKPQCFENTMSKQENDGKNLQSIQCEVSEETVFEDGWMDDEEEKEILQAFGKICGRKNEERFGNEENIQKEYEEARVCNFDVEYEYDGKGYSRLYWARATTETQVKLGDLNEPILALVDHGSEINIMSRDVYERGKWPIDTNHGWVLRAANSQRSGLYGACPMVKTKIGDVEVEQNFFVQNNSTYPVILGQPYITASRMETKVMDDGSHYARIRSSDGRKAVQFMTVQRGHERNRDHLREAPLRDDDFQDF